MNDEAMAYRLSDEQFERWMATRDEQIKDRAKLDCGVWALDKALSYLLSPSHNTFRYGERDDQEPYPTPEQVLEVANVFQEWLASDDRRSTEGKWKIRRVRGSYRHEQTQRRDEATEAGRDEQGYESFG